MSLENLPTNRPLMLDDFRVLASGEVVRLYYWLYRKGSLWWRHAWVEGELLWGQVRFGGDPPWSPSGEEYLFEFDDFICWGEGASPVWAVMPPAPKEDFILPVDSEDFGTDEDWENEENDLEEEEEE